MPRPAEDKKNDWFVVSRWKINRKKGKEIYFLSVSDIFIIVFVWFPLLGRGVGRGFYSHLFFGLPRRFAPRNDRLSLFYYALNVLNDESTFLEITFLTASISVEIADSSVSSCFKRNSKSLSWPWIISIFAFIAWISWSYFALL